jgi:hypothetical protein
MKRFILLVSTAALFCLSTPAAIITYTAELSGTNENPVNASPATGFAVVAIDVVAHTLQIDVVFAGLTAANTAAHIHCCIDPPGNVGVATTTPTFTGFPTGTTSGTYSHIFDLTDASSFRAGFITDNGGTPVSAEAVLAAGLAAGQAYLNIHTSTFPGGEIRGFLEPVPEPATWLLTAVPLLAFGFYRRRACR